MPVSDAHKRASRKWDSSRDNIMIRPDKETGAAIRAAAAKAGQSNQQYILQATLERMEREKQIYTLMVRVIPIMRTKNDRRLCMLNKQ